MDSRDTVYGSAAPGRGGGRVNSPRSEGVTQVNQVIPLVERHQALIEELRATAPRSVPAAQLAQRFGVTSRTIERDIARLVSAGVPITVRRGPGGGYRLQAPRLLPPLTFTSAEAAALLASLAVVGPYSSAAAHSALGKLRSALDCA
jgi:predicted DNA-binding transcriptional regulator YafY